MTLAGVGEFAAKAVDNAGVVVADVDDDIALFDAASFNNMPSDDATVDGSGDGLLAFEGGEGDDAAGAFDALLPGSEGERDGEASEQNDEEQGYASCRSIAADETHGREERIRSGHAAS